MHTSSRVRAQLPRRAPRRASAARARAARAPSKASNARPHTRSTHAHTVDPLSTTAVHRVHTRLASTQALRLDCTCELARQRWALGEHHCAATARAPPARDCMHATNHARRRRRARRVAICAATPGHASLRTRQSHPPFARASRLQQTYKKPTTNTKPPCNQWRSRPTAPRCYSPSPPR